MTQITPTGWAKMGTWSGTRLEGQRFTAEQLATMERRGRPDPAAWDVRTVELKVPREPTRAEIGWGKPREECFDAAKVDCPVVGRWLTEDQVIAPDGSLVKLKKRRAKR